MYVADARSHSASLPLQLLRKYAPPSVSLMRIKWWKENCLNYDVHMRQVNYDRLREMIIRCEWSFAKTMPFAPHEG